MIKHFCHSLLYLAIFFSCTSNSVNTTANIQFKDLDYTSDIYINVINPGDCQTCVSFGKTYFKTILGNKKISQKNIKFIIPTIRDVEVKQLFEDRIPFQNIIDTYEVIVSSLKVAAYRKIIGDKKDLSFLLVVSPKSGKVKYMSYFKSPNFLSEVNKLIDKK